MEHPAHALELALEALERRRPALGQLAANGVRDLPRARGPR
jgi:hypothetical protein